MKNLVRGIALCFPFFLNGAIFKFNALCKPIRDIIRSDDDFDMVNMPRKIPIDFNTNSHEVVNCDLNLKILEKDEQKLEYHAHCFFEDEKIAITPLPSFVRLLGKRNAAPAALQAPIFYLFKEVSPQQQNVFKMFSLSDLKRVLACFEKDKNIENILMPKVLFIWNKGKSGLPLELLLLINNFLLPTTLDTLVQSLKEFRKKLPLRGKSSQEQLAWLLEQGASQEGVFLE